MFFAGSRLHFLSLFLKLPRRGRNMTDPNQKQLGKTLWGIADQLRGAMNADDFRDYMLAFLFLRYLSDNYEQAARKELGATTQTRTPSATAGGPPCLSGTSRTPIMYRISRSRCVSRRTMSFAPSTSGRASLTWPAPGRRATQHAPGRLQIHRDRIVPEHVLGTVLGDQSRLRQARQDLRGPEHEALHDHY